MINNQQDTHVSKVKSTDVTPNVMFNGWQEQSH